MTAEEEEEEERRKTLTLGGEDIGKYGVRERLVEN